MKKYIIKRLLLSIPIIIFISFIAFCLVNIIPSDPAEVALRVNDVTPTPEDIENMRRFLGLDKPFFFRYFSWLWNALKFDFGVSYVNTNRFVANEIARSLPITLKLAGISLIMILGISIPVGVLCAVKKNTFFDRITRIIIFIGTAIPDYWLSLILLSVFALKLNMFPISGINSSKGYILPAFALSMSYISVYIRLIRNNMVETLEEDYIYYARVRGIKEKKIILKHALKNSIHSSLNALGMSIVKLVAGTFVIENIFVLPGLGRLCITAIFNRDYPIIQAYILLMAVLFVICNFLVDIGNAFIDHRLAGGMEND
ncbi:MAG: ABC transporter permease subunit [Fusobacterium sp.]|nr:ABC transporter permease subunit [Fusobacterium sp.]